MVAMETFCSNVVPVENQLTGTLTAKFYNYLFLTLLRIVLKTNLSVETAS